MGILKTCGLLDRLFLTKKMNPKLVVTLTYQPGVPLFKFNVVFGKNGVPLERPSVKDS